ncbi:hypothetical protein FACS1894156_8890 [Bacteroidia bacterium]|nr:hypothetical protein FACS1894156_8890 [Bacteroidia bacterium]
MNGLEKQQISFINEIKQKIRQAQYEAMKAVNVQLIDLYWEIGKSIAEKQQEGWGKSVVKNLAEELQKEFPSATGYSVGNLWLMSQFYTEYHAVENLVPLVREISWSKHVSIMKQCKDNLERKFYILATKKFGWTKNVLIHNIEVKTYEKYMLNQTNFDKNLPDELKNQVLLAVKDEYSFDFLNLAQEHTESELESALVNNIRRFLLEMNYQFAFVGNQFRIEIDDNEYFIDLLLYHRQLQCLVAIELKIGKFIPEYKGKMEFYLAILNDKVKLPNENDAIGIIICKEKNRTVVEYSLKNSNMPIGVATYSTSTTLPKGYENLLPAKAEIEQKINQYFNS